MSYLSILLLGPLQVLLDGRPLSGFATEKTRALLAYLAAERDRAHSRSALAGLLWPDQPEDKARQNLRQTLLYLRQTLGKELADTLLEAERESVQFDAQHRVTVDIAQFVALDEACRQHRHRRPDACLPCIRRLMQLVALYRGDFLSNLQVDDSDLYEEWALPRREWFRRRMVEALIVLTQYEERRGNYAQARRYAQRQVELEPWHEEAHRALMRLLALDGQRSAALAQYRTCRKMLARELAVEPTDETTALYEQIHADTLQTQAPCNNLSRPATVFVGRHDELNELAERLADPDCRLITLIGPGGIGKTRLAMQVAQEHRGVFADGVAFVSLASVGSDALLHAIATALLPPAAAHNLEQLQAYLHAKEFLLVLDNLEHLADCWEDLNHLLNHARGLTILITSREKLGLQEEWVYPLEGLSYPDAPCADPSNYSALLLFRQRAIQARRQFELTPDVLPHVIAICRLVQGLPLGIELAAATTAEQPCAEIAAALERTFDALGTSLHNVPVRQRSLRAAFEHSWNLLTPTQRQHIAALSVFAESLDGEAAREIAGVSTAELGTLTAKSWLTSDGTRYFWHAVTHQYAAERLAQDAAHAAALHTQHSALFAARVAQITPLLHSAKSAEAFARLESDRANLQKAWHWAVTQEDTDATAQMVQGLGELYRRRGPAQKGLEMVEMALERLATCAPPSLLAQLRVEQIRLLNLLARYEEALAGTVALLALEQHAPQIQTTGYFLEGQTLQQQGKNEAAQVALEKALSLVHHVTGAEGKSLEAQILSEIGNALLRCGKPTEAQTCYERALTLYQSLADSRGESTVRNNLGSLYWDKGAYTAAREQLSHALRLYRELGNLPGEAKAFNNLANIAADQRDYGVARQCYQQALEIHRNMGNTRAQSAVLNNLGALYWELGCYAEARQAYRQALAIFVESGNRQAEGETLANLSLLELRLGNTHPALALAQKAVHAAEESHDLGNLANAYTYLGKIYTALDQWDEAEGWYRQAQRLRQELPHPGRQLEITAEIARLTQQRGHPRQALAEIEPVLAAIQDEPALDGAEDPYQVYWNCYEILQANGDGRAPALLTTAQKRLQQQADRIADPALRRAFLHNVPAHRQILKG